MKLTQKEKEFIANEYASGDSFEDIAFATGITVQAVKRALSDIGIIDLSWHKAPYEHDLLQILKQKKVTNPAKLREALKWF